MNIEKVFDKVCYIGQLQTDKAQFLETCVHKNGNIPT